MSGRSLPKVGTNLYRNLDNEFLRSLRAERKIPTAIRFEAIADGYRLTIGDYSATFVAEHQPATNPQRALQTIVQQLSKLGDTDFVAKDVQVFANEQPCSDTFPYFIPTSQLNQWRRELITSHSETTFHLQRSDLPTTGEAVLQRSDLLTTGEAFYPLMTCKYCILYELGHCRKINPMANEPCSLRLQNGTRLSLEFDCKNCEMRISKH